MIDWRDQRHSNVIKVAMVSPTNLEDVYGELEGVDLSGSSLSAGYYTDTRTQGSIAVVGDGWIRGSFLRITHEIPEWDFSRDLGTYLVTDDGASRSNGIWHYDLQLQSMLFALSTEKARTPWTIAKGARAKTAMRQILESAGRPYIDVSSNDYIFGSPLVMDSGQTLLSRMFALTQPSGNRLDVDGRGYVTISPYILPDSKVPQLEIDLADPRGIAHDDLERTTDWLQMPTEAAVSFKYSTTENGSSVQHEINAWATVSADSHASRAIRGYVVTDFRTVSDLNPQTQAEAQRLANLYLNGDSREHIEWNLTTQYLPIWEGDVIALRVHDGQSQYRGVRKCLVKNVELDLQFMTMQLTLKETSSGDDNE